MFSRGKESVADFELSPAVTSHVYVSWHGTENRNITRPFLPRTQPQLQPDRIITLSRTLRISSNRQAPPRLVPGDYRGFTPHRALNRPHEPSCDSRSAPTAY